MKSIASITYLNYKKILWKKYHSRTIKYNVTGNTTQRGKYIYIFYPYFLVESRGEVMVWNQYSRWMGADASKRRRKTTDRWETEQVGKALAFVVHFPVDFLNSKFKFVELTQLCFSFFKGENYWIQSFPSYHPKQIIKTKQNKNLHSCRNSQVFGIQKYAPLN